MEVEGAGAEEGSSESHAAAHVGLDAKVGMAAEFVTAGMRFCQSPSLQHVLLRLLSGLFQVQELTTPSLKPLQLEASTAFALLKYLPVSVRHVQDVVDSILESPKMDQWSARAAGLVYLQVTVGAGSHPQRREQMCPLPFQPPYLLCLFRMHHATAVTPMDCAQDGAA
eukprot:evm.model.scf_728EXC.12 EVM.evm.TU.scf_728EXC.12   scf_728EXC:63610-64956(-)